MKRQRVLIVDDSAIIRKLLKKILESSPGFEVVGTAQDPYVARDMLVELRPDLMTLDVEMPRMDGITFLEKVMKNLPTRTVVISSLTTEKSPLALRALECGAVDVIAKPAVDVRDSLSKIKEEIVSVLQKAASANLEALVMTAQAARSKAPVKKFAQSQALAQTTHQILAIASSTGGTNALREFLGGLDLGSFGVVIVQHMPPNFTKSFAESLNSSLAFEVKEAEDRERIMPGKILLAPGNFHLEIKRIGGYYHSVLHQEPRLHSVRPAADYLFNSVAKHAASNSVGVVLTGMGKDGAKGLLKMKEAGSYNYAQDEASCVVYGMPKAAVELGAIDRSGSLGELAREVNQYFKRKEAA